jgi:peptide/nickel transport system substrate-binding protein
VIPAKLTASLIQALAVASLVGLACAPAGQTTPTGTSGQGQTAPSAANVPQTLVVGMATLPAVLDSQANLGFNPRRYGLYEMLVGQKDDGSVEPLLATEWKTLNDTTWQFKLALANRKFHDGTAVTADDIKYSIDRAKDPDKKMGTVARLTTVKEVVVVDPNTLNIVTNAPDGLLLKRAAYVPVYPKAYLEKVGDAEFGIKPIGSGPYRLKEWVPNDRLVLTSVPDHPTKPTLTEITFKLIGEGSARIAGLKTGDLDMINAAPLDQVDGLKNGGFQTLIIDTGSSNGFFMDPIIEGSPTKDKRVRQAINYAIDKDSVSKNIYKGYARVDAGQPLQSETFGFNPNVKAYPYDPAMAKQLLAQAGYPNGFKTSMEVYVSQPEWQSVGLLVQQQLKDVGIELDIQMVSDTAAWLDHFYGRKPRPALLSVGLQASPAMDADFALIWFKSSQPVPVKHYDNPEFDKFYDPSVTEVNEAKRLDLLQKAVRVLHDDPPFLFLVSSPQVWVYKKGLEGVTKRTDQEPKFENIKRTN